MSWNSTSNFKSKPLQEQFGFFACTILSVHPLLLGLMYYHGRLRVENAALRERVASVQRLTESAHRLRMALVKASNDSQNEKAAPSLQVALEVVKGVSAEAQQLKIALGCSLPISWPGQEIVPEPEQSSDLSVGEATVSSVEGAARAAIDTASAAGIEMVELLLATSELQKQALQCQLDMLAK
jgi:hypothetical protein